MLISILTAFFVLACSAFSIAMAVYVYRFERRRADEVILAAEPLRPEWVRMDVPGKYPAVRTRHAKVLR